MEHPLHVGLRHQYLSTVESIKGKSGSTDNNDAAEVVKGTGFVMAHMNRVPCRAAMHCERGEIELQRQILGKEKKQSQVTVTPRELFDGSSRFKDKGHKLHANASRS